MIPDRIRTRRSALAQAVPHRFSCHHFSAAPSLTDWSSLSYLCGRWEYGDLHLRLVRVPESFLAGGILLAVGLGLFISYFAGKKMLAKEIEAEEKSLEK